MVWHSILLKTLGGLLKTRGLLKTLGGLLKTHGSKMGITENSGPITENSWIKDGDY